MSQLNPNAAEFVPVSPTRSIPSPACRTLINDQVISQSPRRPTANDIDINVPNAVEFEKEVKSRPSEVDSYSNGHEDTSLNRTATDLMETILNGKSIDEIPEFQPGSTPTKIVANEEFHFGPNAAPFTPVKQLDQSEAALSTKAVYGDESTATLGTSFNESITLQNAAADLDVINKESDPMSMSFYADKEDGNPFDLNQVHMLPDNIDEFLKKPDTSTFNDSISDLPEHYPLGQPKDTTEDLILNNDDAIQTTDLDKGAYYDEKELASPLEPEKEQSESEREMLEGVEEIDFSKTPEPTHENLLMEREFCLVPEKCKTPDSLPRDVELISPEPRAVSVSPRPGENLEEISKSKSPLHEATEVADLLAQPEELPRDVELISPELGTSRPDSTHEETSQSPRPEASEVDDLLGSKSPMPQPIEVNVIEESKSPLPDAFEVDVSSKSPLPETCELPQSKTPTSDILEAKSPLPNADSPICELPISKSPVCELEGGKSPVCERPVSDGAKSPVCEFKGAESPVFGLEESKSPVCEIEAAKSPVCEIEAAKSPVCERPESKSPVGELGASHSPLHLEIQSPSLRFGDEESGQPTASPDFTKHEELEKADKRFEEICKSEENLNLPAQEDHTTPEVIEMAQERFDEIFKPQEVTSPGDVQEDVTSSLRDNVASPAGCALLDQIIEDSFVADQSANDQGLAQESVVEATMPEICQFAAFKPAEDAESVAASDVNSFLERSLPPDVASPLSPVDKQLDESPNEQRTPQIPDLDHPLMKCVYPLPPQLGEHIDIKTENISPEFAEQAIVTPSEESRQEDVPAAPLLEEPAKEPVVEEKTTEEVVAVGGVAAAGAAAVAVAAAKAAAPVKADKEEKKKVGALAAKKPAAPKTASRTVAKASTATPKPASRLSASPKTSPAKTGTAKPAATAAAPKPAATRPSPRPKPAAAAPKSTEKKPLANGDIKSTVKSTASRKTVSETTTARSASARPATAAAATRLSPTKPATARPAAPRPATAAPAPRTTTTRTTTSTLGATAKPRPTSLTSRTTPTAASAAAKPATTTKSPPTKTSPRTTATTRPKPPATTLSALSKPRVPLTKTITKTADTEKQNKESANKLTASRSVTSTTRTTSATARTTSSTLRKVESKVAATTRTSKTTMTTTKSTTAKKPTEIVRHAISKTKTTKVEKPKENGVSTVVTEEITIVSNGNAAIESVEPQLLKDNSPVDNKLIIDTLIQTSTAD